MTPAFKSHSPLDSLVRRTSARRTNATVYPNRGPYTQDSDVHLRPSLAPLPEIPSRHVPQHQLSPASPLLHGHFARDSIATASSSDNYSYRNSSSTSSDSRTVDAELGQRYYDDESIYSDSTESALRDSWKSAGTSNTALGGREFVANLEVIPSNPVHYPQQQPSSNKHVPTLIVSSPKDPVETKEYTRAGRTPITGLTGSNFSRPVRPPLSSTLENDQQKRRVLERNSRRAPSPTHHTQTRLDEDGNISSFPFHFSPAERAESPTMGVGRSIVRSPSLDQGQTGSSYSAPPSAQAPGILPVRSLSPAMRQQSTTATLPGSTRPPSLRVASPASLYSGYSFYQLGGSASLSPTNVESHDRLHGCTPPIQVALSPPVQLLPTPHFSSDLDRGTPTPQDYVQQGIQHHEANRLKESAICFEKSAKENGGCGIGMLMWGLALRHGWGCEKNEKFAFKWLTRAAESAVEDLENARTGGGIDAKVVQTELVLAIYEVGQCFFQGWGVAKDQKMAVSYYTVAARLGDPDAQNDLAFCLANGKGCKKDRKEAAKWYRAAVAQGQSDIGLAWIYKEKYQ